MKNKNLYKGKHLGKWYFGGVTSQNHSVDENIRIISYSWEEGNEENIFFTVHSVDEETVCQCIGIEDKDGELLFENDIIESNGWKYIIVYENFSFMFRLLSTEKLFRIDKFSNIKNIKKICNLYD